MCRFAFLGLCFLLSGCVHETVSLDKGSIEKPVHKQQAALSRVQLGLGYLEQNQLVLAKDNFDKARSLAPQLPEVFVAYADYFRMVQEPQQAKAMYQKAIEIAPDEPQVLYAYGDFLCEQNQFYDGQTVLKRSLKSDANSSMGKTYEALGRCSMTQGDFKKSKGYFLKAINYDKHLQRSYLGLASIALKQKHYTEANLYLRQYKASWPVCSESLWLSYQLNRAHKNEEDASKDLTRLLGGFPYSKQSITYRESTQHVR